MPKIRGELKTVDINSVWPNDYNPNEMPPDLMAKEEEAFKRFGVIRSILVRQISKSRWSIIDGEHRYKILKEAGMKRIQIRDLGPIPDDEAKALTVVLNEIKGTPDFIKAAELFASVKSYDAEVLSSFLPYKPEEIQTMIDAVSFDFSEYGSPKDPFEPDDGAPYAKIACRVPQDESGALDAAAEAQATRLGIEDKNDAIKFGRVFSALLKASVENNG